MHARKRGLAADDDSGAFETPAPPHSELAGFESWRTEVWGSAPVRRLGLTILPSLAAGNVEASGARLDALEAEVERLQDSLRTVVDELLANGTHILSRRVWTVDVGESPNPNDPHEDVRFRLANIAEAVRLARLIPDGAGEVVIW